MVGKKKIPLINALILLILFRKEWWSIERYHIHMVELEKYQATLGYIVTTFEFPSQKQERKEG